MNQRRAFLRAAGLGAGAIPAFAAQGRTSASEAYGPYSFDVRQSGAAGDGLHMDTRAIQSAIDRCAQSGGGTVWFPKGKYLTGTFILKENVTLHLTAGATILGSPRREDYLDRAGVNGSPEFERALIYAGKANGIGIQGLGTIDGQGAQFDGKSWRPRLLYFEDCTAVRLTDVLLRNAGFWVSHYRRCDDLVFRGVRIDSLANWNNDGLDIDGCQGVFIEGCNIVCSDDAICLKSEITRPCRNIVITNCVIKTCWGGIKFGTPGLGGFQNIAISNCVFHDTVGGAVKLELVDGGVLENVAISNLVMDNVTGPFFIRLGDRGSRFRTGLPPGPPGRLRNVRISDVEARLATEVNRSLDGKTKDRIAPDWETRLGSMIMGLPEHPIENVTLQNIHVIHPGGGTSEEARLNPPERGRDYPSKDYPEYVNFGPMPAWGLYARHVRGLNLRGITFETVKSDLRPAMRLDDVEDADVFGLRVPGGAESSSSIAFQDTRKIFLHGCRLTEAVPAFLALSGGISDIVLSGNDTRLAKDVVRLAPGVPADAVQKI